MRKKTILAACLGLVAMPALAGGLVTNTNQNAAFLRQLSQDAIIDITGLYANPAGTAFLGRGFHMSLNVQNAKQNRDITTTFPLFKQNLSNPSETHKFRGEAFAPVIPSFQLSYNWEKWSINAHGGLTGGGGKAEFDKGLGSFEALYAAQIYSQVPGALNQTNAAYGTDLDYGGYTMNAYMRGRQYHFGLSLGTTYKFSDNLSAYFGLRGVYATNNYTGWVSDVKVSVTSALAATNPVVAGVLAATEASINGKLAQTALDLNTDQTGFGITPIIGVNWTINRHWNVAVKYEAPTKMTLKNKSVMNAYTAQVAAKNPTLGQFADGAKVRADIPGIVTLGAQYTPIEKVRLMGGFHYYFDKQAKQYGDKQKQIDHGTWEITAGAEYDVHRLVTVSAGWQTTRYGLKDGHLSDLSFVTSSNSIGLGVRIHATEHLDVDLGYMQTFYQDREVTTIPDPTRPTITKKDLFSRTNRVLGVGFNLKF